MHECGKASLRRLHDANFATRYLVGGGIDIGGGDDPLGDYMTLFPMITDVVHWDLEQGDGQYLQSIADNTFDFVHSSHCLEHLVDPGEGLRNWFRVLRPGGHLVVTVPDEDLYEQRAFPSRYNPGHRWTFTIYKKSSWSPKSLNVLDLLVSLGATAEIKRIQLLDAGFRCSFPPQDQTMTIVGECAIEIVVRKRLSAEVAASE